MHGPQDKSRRDDWGNGSQPSLRDLATVGHGPSVETLGYSRASLRDDDDQKLVTLDKNVRAPAVAALPRCVYLCSSVVGSQSFAPGGDDLLEYLRQAACQPPLGVVRFYLAQVAVVTNMVSATRLVQIGMNLLFAGARQGHLKGFKDRAGVFFAPAQIIDLAGAGRLIELEHEARHICRMDIVADLFALIAINLVFAAFKIALHQVAEEAVQLDP